MTDRIISQDKIREYWSKQVEKYGNDPAVSWSDIHIIDLEIREILLRIQENTKILDVGCANGYSTIKYAKEKCIDIKGIDYIPQMILEAKKNLALDGNKVKRSLEFSVGDILNIESPKNYYDVVIAKRVVINLGSWENQLSGLRECSRVLKKGGLLLVSEAIIEGWRNLNAFRCEWGLEDIPIPEFNVYLSRERVISALADEFELLESSNFSNAYYVGTRVIKPILAKLSGIEANIANPLMHMNRFFTQIRGDGDYGIQHLFVFRKK